MNKKIFQFIFCGLLCTNCKLMDSQIDQESEVEFTSNANLVIGGNGHEYITLYAMELILNADVPLSMGGNAIKDVYGVKVIPNENVIASIAQPNIKGYRVPETHSIIKGNVASDWPSTFPALSLFDIWGLHYSLPFEDKSDSEWQNEPKINALHFLRPIDKNGQIVSAFATCQNSRKIIFDITKMALESAYKGDRNRSLGLIGHATHIIQDAFSKAHVVRDNNKDLTDICTYGSKYKRANICYHSTLLHGHEAGGGSVLSEDRIWKESEENGEYKYLKDEANLAVWATSRYFLIVGRYLNNALKQRLPVSKQAVEVKSSMSEIGLKLNTYFDAKTSKGTGLFSCSKLSKN